MTTPGEVLPADEDQRVPFKRLVEELGWTANTVRRYMTALNRVIVAYPGETGDRRKKLYPLRRTTELLRREHARVEARRRRASDAAASYWQALSTLKVAAGRLGRLTSELSSAEGEVRKAFQELRDRPPGFVMEIASLEDPGLSIFRPLLAMVAPLRLTYWKASLPELGLRAEGRTSDDALLQLREKLATSFRDLERDPDQNRQLWDLLNEFIQVRNARTRRAQDEGDGV